MAELRATPQNKALATLANSLRSARETGDVVDIPVLGGLGSLLLGKSPEEVEEWSYGNAPMQMTPLGVRLPQMKRGRGPQLADTVFAAVDRPALRSLTAAVGKSLAKALENSSFYDMVRQLQAPNPEYLPYIQGFVRNSPLGSQWSDVGDLATTGLISACDQNAMVRAALTGRPISIDEGYAAAKRLGERQPFYTQEELIEAFKNEFPDKFAQGGMVQPSWPEPEYNSWDVFAREL